MTTFELDTGLVGAVDTNAWLTDLLRQITEGTPHAQDIDENRLRSIAFIEIIRAMERADRASIPATILLYQHWIASHPLDAAHLHLAWFNLGVALTQAERLPNA